ncbi:MAG: hypothetical protein AAGU32_16895 [Bacillota bacterium]
MGVYGSPEFLDYIRPQKTVCKKCGYEFHGKYCPECGAAAQNGAGVNLLGYFIIGFLVVSFLFWITKGPEVSEMFRIFSSTLFYSVFVFAYCLIRAIFSQKKAAAARLALVNIAVFLASLVGAFMTTT